MKILIIDDEAMIREWIDMSVKSSSITGIETIFASDGEEGITLLEKEVPDLVFTDITMPKLDGIEFLKRARLIDKTVKIYMLTCHKEFEFARTAIKYNISDYLLKSELSKDSVIKIVKDCEKSLVKNSSTVLKNGEILKQYLLSKHEEIELTNSNISLENKYNLVIAIISNPIKINQFDFSKMSLLNNLCVFSLHSSLVIICGNLIDSNISQLMIDNEITEFLNTYFINVNQIAISDIKPKLSDLIHSFQDVIRKINIKFFNLEDNIDLCSNEDDIYTEIIEKKNEIINYGSSINGKEFVEKISQMLLVCRRTYCVQIYYIKRILTELIVGIGTKKSIENNKYAKYISEIDESTNINRIKEILEDFSKLIEFENYDSKYISRAKYFISNNYFKPISLSDVSSYVCISEEYFSRLFKKELGINFVEYLNEYRIKKAKILLLSRDLNVTEVGEMVGISNPSYFAAQFKKFYGYSPSKVKK